MATVWHAHDRTLGRDVAIKVLDPHANGSFDRDRFLLEIRVTARLVHPGILPLFDSGTADDHVFFVMPLVLGETLRQRLDRESQLSVDDAVGIVSDLAEALAYAHGEGVVHRDLKPENVFCHAGRTLLGDFGVARAAGLDTARTGDDRLTSVGVVIGTPLYLSPEQALGDTHTDGRADLYALGCLFYEMLAGRPPYHGSNVMALITQHVTAPVPDLAAVRPDAGPAIARIITTLLAKDPDDRFANASAFLAELRRAVAPAGHSSGEIEAGPPIPSAAQRIVHEGARAAYINGRNYWMRSMQGGRDSESKLKLARVYLERARELAPDDPRVLAALADCILVFGLRGFAPLDVARADGQDLLHRALAIDDSVGGVHAALGVDFMYWQDDFESARAELRAGRDLDPNDAMARRQYGNYLKMNGEIDRAIEEMRAAIAIDPRAPFMHLGLGDCLIAAGRNDEAVHPLRNALRLAPAYIAAIERLEIACHRAGRHEEAGVARSTLHNIRDQVDRAKLLSADIAALGWPAARAADIRRDRDALLARAETTDPFIEHGSRQAADAIISAHAELGEWNAAMDWVERGYHRRPGRLRRVLTDLLFDRRGLAFDPRYAPLLRNAGLSDLL